MKKILVPTDFSGTSKKALEYAATIAKQTGAEIHLLHVGDVREPKIEGEQQEGRVDLMLSVEAEFQILEKKTRSTELKLFTTYTEGNIIDAICDTAKQGSSDLIVMGATRETTMSNKLFGSITTGVISSAEVPVIVIPKDCDCTRPDKILIAISDPLEDLSRLSNVMKVAECFDSSVTVVTFTKTDEIEIPDEGSDKLYIIKDKLQYIYPRQYFKTKHLTGKHLTEALTEFISANAINVLIMITHGKGFSGFLSYSNTREMAIQTTIPLIAIPAKAK